MFWSIFWYNHCVLYCNCFVILKYEFSGLYILGLIISKVRLKQSVESSKLGISWNYTFRVQNRFILLNYLLNVFSIDCTSLLPWAFHVKWTDIIKGILLFLMRLTLISKDGIKKGNGTNYSGVPLLPVDAAIVWAVLQRA